MKMLISEADEGLKLKKEREADRGSRASQRGEVRAKQNIVDPEGINMREEQRASEPKRRERMKRYWVLGMKAESRTKGNREE